MSQDIGWTEDGPTQRDATEPEVTEAVAHVRDRFGVDGLRSLIALAEEELRTAEQAVTELAEWEEQHQRADAAGPEA